MVQANRAPTLKKVEKVEDWKPFFQAGTEGLRATEGGVLKALQMLPSYANRSYAERKLVIEVVEENQEASDLEAAFETR